MVDADAALGRDRAASSGGRRDAEVRLRDGLALLQLRDDRLGSVDRDREADVLRILRAGGVDADDLAVERQQRTTGVAGVDGRVGLQEVGQVLTIVGVDRAVECRDDAFSGGRPAGQCRVRCRSRRPARRSCRSDDWPSGSAVSPVLSTLITARSSVRSTPSTLADALVPSENTTSIEVASATTCALVAICPSLLMTKPVPAAWPLFSTTLMLTTPGRALLMSAETSDLAFPSTAWPDVPTDVVSKPPAVADGWDVVESDWLAGECATDGAAGDRQDGDRGESQTAATAGASGNPVRGRGGDVDDGCRAGRRGPRRRLSGCIRIVCAEHVVIFLSELNMFRVPETG